jgi:hypothetical protein
MTLESAKPGFETWLSDLIASACANYLILKLSFLYLQNEP